MTTTRVGSALRVCAIALSTLTLSLAASGCCKLSRGGGGTDHLMVPVSAFQVGAPTDDDWDFEHISSRGGFGSILGGTAPYEVRLYAPVNLPHGATVTELASYYLDKAPGDMEIDLSLVHQGTGANFGMASVAVNSSGTANVIASGSDTTISDAVVDASTDRVWLVVTMKVTDPSIDLRFYGARITYSKP